MLSAPPGAIGGAARTCTDRANIQNYSLHHQHAVLLTLVSLCPFKRRCLVSSPPREAVKRMLSQMSFFVWVRKSLSCSRVALIFNQSDGSFHMFMFS